MLKLYASGDKHIFDLASSNSVQVGLLIVNPLISENYIMSLENSAIKGIFPSFKH